jgi:hypothetical protein
MAAKDEPGQYHPPASTVMERTISDRQRGADAQQKHFHAMKRLERSMVVIRKQCGEQSHPDYGHDQANAGRVTEVPRLLRRRGQEMRRR